MTKKKSLSGKQESYFLADNKIQSFAHEAFENHYRHPYPAGFSTMFYGCWTKLPPSRCDGGASKESVWADIIMVLVPEMTTGRNLSYQHKGTSEKIRTFPCALQSYMEDTETNTIIWMFNLRC